MPQSPAAPGLPQPLGTTPYQPQRGLRSRRSHDRGGTLAVNVVLYALNVVRPGTGRVPNQNRAFPETFCCCCYSSKEWQLMHPIRSGAAAGGGLCGKSGNTWSSCLARCSRLATILPHDAPQAAQPSRTSGTYTRPAPKPTAGF